MRRFCHQILLGVACAAVLAQPALAKLRVTASIAPVHSLVAQVMKGTGEPQLLMPAGASPHHFAMRPSDARALHRADVVFWVGPALEAWMAKPLSSLPKKISVVTLGEADGLTRHPLRKGGVWEAHDHDDHNDHNDHKDHDEHRGHAHEDAETRTKGHDHHHHGAVEAKTRQAPDFPIDQHFWLDPKNAGVWIEQIARVLVEKDPSNAERYKKNAFEALQRLAALEKRIKSQLAPVRDRPFIVFHDAYRHFEERFGLQAAGSISLPDAAAPGPARLSEIRKKIASSGAICVFTEPQFPARLARMATDGGEARIGELDPLGAEVAAGPELYDAMMLALAEGMRACLAEGTTSQKG